MQLFYLPNHNTELVQLSEEESAHCIRVLRKQLGDTIQCLNGKGLQFECRILDPHPKKCTLEIVKTTEHPNNLPYKLHLAVAPTKNMDRMEWLIEKATEMRISSFSPIICQRSERREIKTERLFKTALSAAKQSLNFHIPIINEAQTLKQFVATANPANTWMAHCMEHKKDFMSSVVNQKGDITVLIGPEGDFSQEELDLIIEKGIRTLDLGPVRFRTETAALFVASACLSNQVL